MNDYFLQVRLYDTASQRRPVVSVDFRESPIKAVAADPNGHDVYIGTGTGDLASFDMRTGMLSWYMLSSAYTLNYKLDHMMASLECYVSLVSIFVISF